MVVVLDAHKYVVQPESSDVETLSSGGEEDSDDDAPKVQQEESEDEETGEWYPGHDKQFYLGSSIGYRS